MKLHYPHLDHEVKTIQEQLEEMVVTHELIENKKLLKPLLTFGEDKIEGTKKIISYLEELHDDMKKGYYCNC